MFNTYSVLQSEWFDFSRLKTVWALLVAFANHLTLNTKRISIIDSLSV